MGLSCPCVSVSSVAVPSQSSLASLIEAAEQLLEVGAADGGGADRPGPQPLDERPARPPEDRPPLVILALVDLEKRRGVGWWRPGPADHDLVPGLAAEAVEGLVGDDAP